MELRHLRYFAQVARTLNFRRAAELLHVSRPALSMQIRNLEEELGVRLLVRDTVSVRLTEAGRVFLADVDEILTRADQAVQRARDAAAGHRGRLIIGEMGPLTPSFLPIALRRFSLRYPSIQVSIIAVDREEQLRALREGRLDVGFLVDVDLHLPEGFASRPLMSSRIGLAVARDHPLAGRSSVRLEELVNEDFVVNHHRQARSHVTVTREVFECNGLPLPRLLSAESFDGLITMVSAQQGVSLMPENMTEMRPHDLVFVPIPKGLQVARITFLAVWFEAGASSHVRGFIDAFGSEKVSPRVVGD